MSEPYFKKGVLLINIGTPENTEISSIRKFLKVFLMDRRVISIPYILRWFILNLFILPHRSAKVAVKYKRIWKKEGSPLMIYSKRIKQLLNEELGKNYLVEIAMRYGSPSIQTSISKLMQKKVNELQIIPLFPQYSSAATGSAIEKVLKTMQRFNYFPKIQINSSFYDHSDYIQTIANIGKSHKPAKYDHILFSFHGIPVKQLTDPTSKTNCIQSSDCCREITEMNHNCYRAQCFKTAHLIANSLDINPKQYSVSFQSRLGKTEWIKPYTVELVQNFPKSGVKKLLVFCPSFVIDCLETLDEIGFELSNIFVKHGGEKLELVPALNDHLSWIQTLSDWIKDK
ncbi:MAG: ferrochelatase [Deltaproteobacteria bacterium]|jgi:protoporphyrin/coproporphyrin ferrochelatase|nr:ferrochelatase [Deltaproteobacteria bacterium]MBT4527781.1 ferrochelatase [Deltaproteobacteria bacterium]